MTENGIAAANIINPRVVRERSKFGRLRSVPFTVTFDSITRAKQEVIWSLATGSFEVNEIND